MAFLPSVLPPTEALGVQQGALIIKSFLDLSFAALRGEHSWALDYIFKNVEYDLATNSTNPAVNAGPYGKSWAEQAKKWFLSTDIPVYWNVALESDGPPMITLALLNAQQQYETLGDIHYNPTETVNLPPQAVTEPFTPVSFDPATGTMVLPDSLANAYIFAGTMAVKTASGNQYPIFAVIDGGLELADGINDDFTNCTVIQPNPNGLLTLESTRMKETYGIMLHVISEPWHLIVLDSIVAFCLMAFKEDLLEGRGFEMSSFTKSDFSKNFADVEARYQRSYTLEGYTQIRYPKLRVKALAGVVPQILISDGGTPAEPLGPNYAGVKP